MVGIVAALAVASVATAQEAGATPATEESPPGQWVFLMFMGVAAVASFFNMSNRMASAIDMMPNLEYHAAARTPPGDEAG